jgi:uncharacterized lipoprotein YajG
MSVTLRIAALIVVLAALTGCADKRITLTYAADPAFTKVADTKGVTVFWFQDSRGDEGDKDPYRVGGVYGGYGNRLSKVMADAPWQRTLAQALATGLQARGVDPVKTEERELTGAGQVATPLGLAGEIRNFSTESRWTIAGHISGVVRLHDAHGAKVFEKTFSARETTGAGGGVLMTDDWMQNTMNATLATFVRNVVSDDEFIAALKAAR